MRSKVVSVSLLVVVLTLLFSSSLYAEGLTLSLSDPELGSFVMEKKNPIKTDCPCGMGGVSVGKYSNNGEWLGIQMDIGNAFPAKIATPPGKYGCDCDIPLRLFDKTGVFYKNVTCGHPLPPLEDVKESSDRHGRMSLEEIEKVLQYREKLHFGMALLLEKYFDSHPDWKAEMGSLIRAKNIYELHRNAIRSAPKGFTLYLYMYRGNAFDLPSGAYHTATWMSEVYNPQNFISFPNHGRGWNGDGMTRYCTAWGDAPIAWGEGALMCATDYGIFSGQHVCNDDTILQKYYVCTNGQYPNRYGECCSDDLLYVKAPACSCSYNKSPRGLAPGTPEAVPAKEEL